MKILFEFLLEFYFLSLPVFQIIYCTYPNFINISILTNTPSNHLISEFYRIIYILLILIHPNLIFSQNVFQLHLVSILLQNI